MKPRLTRKVLDGLGAMEAAINAGNMLNGDLATDRDEVEAAMDWINAMFKHRRAQEAAAFRGRAPGADPQRKDGTP